MKLMKPMKLVFFLLLFLGTYAIVHGQCFSYAPFIAQTDDSLTIYFDPTNGGKELENEKTIILTTAAIIDENTFNDGRMPILKEKRQKDITQELQRQPDGKFIFKLHIRSFYNIPADALFSKLVFNFQNKKQNIIATDNNNVNFYAYINQYQDVIYDSHSFKAGVLHVKTKSGSYSIKPLTNEIVKVELLSQNSGEQYISHSVVLEPEKVYATINEQIEYVELLVGELKVHINKIPFSISYIYKSDTIACEEKGLYDTKYAKGLRLKIKNNESIYGAGMRSVSLDRRGWRLKLYNEPHYGYSLNATDLNYSIPLIMSSKTYSILFDNPQKGMLDVAANEKNIVDFSVIGGSPVYYFICGENHDKVMENYTKLTGNQPLPPRWALGNFMSRFGYKSQAEVIETYEKMQTAGFPVDAVIIDLYWFGKGVHGSFYMGNLDWDNENWNNPQQLIKQLNESGVKTVLITEPFIMKESKNFDYTSENNLLATDSQGKTFIIEDFWFGATGLLDIFKPETQEWFWTKYKKQIDIGVAGWWGDLGEPEKHPAEIFHINGKADEVHNIYGHYWDKMLFEKYATEYPEVRLFNLNRSGFAGSQRFGVYPWSGDVSRSWEGFQAQMPIQLGMSLCGLSYMHSDLGGFAMGEKDDELYTRWLQYGAFNPIFRPHGGAEFVPSEPVFFSEESQKITKKYINMRYSLLPYLYTMCYENTVYGKALARPMFFAEPENEELRNISDQYFWGDNFIIAPVLEKAAKKHKIYLPFGVWYDYITGNRYEGGQWIEQSLTLEDIPIFVKAGSFIPTVNTVNNTQSYSSESLTINFYPDAAVPESKYTMYDDDGKTANAIENNQYELLNFKATNTDNGVFINLTKGGGAYVGMPTQRTMKFVINTLIAKPEKIEIDGQTVAIREETKLSVKQAPVAQWNETRKELTIIFVWNGTELILSVFN